ncbi:glycosyltransferase family 4 protein [Pseudomonas helleri]|uniref:glycosyltransferase family 4 protein n=1 Tax=Pseudomonas helleri TaxID=1608996 RepID=UPI0021C72AA9|nr:glycosyltransferase family 1 protein [Pseudomonas helleri]MCU1756083.1 glycosyltransferase family 4 protein [Pseudomonas helleri]
MKTNQATETPANAKDTAVSTNLDGVIFDSRWIGSHGIGRFAKEVSERLKFTVNYSSTINPAGLFSAFALGLWATPKRGKSIFSPSYIPPVFSSLPFSFTIHDLNHIDVSHNSSLFKRIYYRTIILPAVKRAYRVLTVSEFSKKKIIDWSGCSPEKIKVVGNGVSEAFNYSAQPICPGYSYIFCCSNRKGHKNEVRLLHAFKKSTLYQEMKLVFTGKPDAEILEAISNLQLEDHVIFTGKVSENDLASWYKGAIMTAFPSLYEGFGLPLIESMACGTPVIASNTTSLPEIGGDAAYYVNPLNVDDIAVGLMHVAKNESLRNQMCEKGLLRAQQFTWDRTANLVSNALKGIT